MWYNSSSAMYKKVKKGENMKYKRKEKNLTIAMFIALIIIIILICTILIAIVNKNSYSYAYACEEISVFTEEIPIEEEILLQEENNNETEILEETISQEDINLLAQIMYAEEGILFQYYEKDPDKVERVHKLCGSVVLHRIENHYRNAETISDVLYSNGQYAKATLDRVESNKEIPEVIYQWAEELLRDGSLGPENLIFQAQFKQGQEVYEHIYNQYFCLK